MVIKLNEHSDKDILLPKEEIDSYYKRVYKKSNKITKIKLKCWYHYCEGRFQGGKNALPFATYCKRTTNVDYLMLTKSYLIDLADIGGRDEALRVLSMHISNSKD